MTPAASAIRKLNGRDKVAEKLIAKITIEGADFVAETVQRVLEDMEPDESPEFIRGFKTFGEAVVNALVKLSEEAKE